MDVGVGVSAHSGWAWVVCGGFDGNRPTILRRDRVELTTGARQPYHEARGRDPVEADRIVADGWDAARVGARRALEQLVAELQLDDVVAIAVLGLPRDVPGVATVLASHARMHACEGELYRAVVAEEAVGLGLRASRDEPDATVAPDWEQAFEVARATLGPPWRKEHREAAASALRLVTG